MMLRIAADYDRFAERADDRAAPDAIMFRSAEEVWPESNPEAQLAGPDGPWADLVAIDILTAPLRACLRSERITAPSRFGKRRNS